MAKHL